jgi:hypothetical protein
MKDGPADLNKSSGRDKESVDEHDSGRPTEQSHTYNHTYCKEDES